MIPRAATAAPRLTGALLFLFIPLVLFLYVAHPAPIGLSLAVGVALMLSHRRLARPYMQAVRDGKCLWCNRPLAAATGEGEPFVFAGDGTTIPARVCGAPHGRDADRFLTFLWRGRGFFLAGIGIPVLWLLATLLLAALGRDVPLEATTRLFQLVVGVTVNVAAWGYLLSPAGAPRTPFPAHNLFLLGIRNLLWVFRLVGAWWIARGVLWLLG